MHFQVLTLFPELIDQYLSAGLLSRAVAEQHISVSTTQLRNFAINAHGQVDDTPYGGGSGMLLRVETAVGAIEAARASDPAAQVIHFSPRGVALTQELARSLLATANSRHSGFIMLCSRYEGIDQRIADQWVDLEISLGDFVLMGGELAALAFIETLARLQPGVLGNADSPVSESFSSSLLEYSQWTKPAEFRGLGVPAVLISGNHEEIRRWREVNALTETVKRRPDLLLRQNLRPQHELAVALMHYPMLDKQNQVITSSLTLIDLHDIARSVRTYGVNRFYVIHPVKTMRRLATRICEHWESGFGASYNPNRKDALASITIMPNLDDALSDIERRTGTLPQLISTSAHSRQGQLSFDELRLELALSAEPHLLLFGTGWGLAPELLERCQLHLEPIAVPASDYNHLSVRAAAAITLDRLLG